MDKLVVVEFSDGKSAHEGMSALHSMNGEAGFSLNRLALIRKDADGTVVTERIDDDLAPPGGTLPGRRWVA